MKNKRRNRRSIIEANRLINKAQQLQEEVELKKMKGDIDDPFGL